MWSASIPSRATFSLAGMVELLGALRGDDLAVASARRAPWRGGGVRLPPRRSIPPARSGDLSRAWCWAPLSLAKRAKVIGEVVGVVTPTGTLAMFEALERAGSCPPCSSSGVMGWRSGRRPEVRTASRAAPSKTTRETVTTMGPIRSPVAWCEWNRPRSGGSRPITMRGGPSRSRRESVAISATSCTGAQSRHCSSPISPRAARSWLSPLSRARDQGVGAPHRRIGVARLNRSREAHSWRARHGVPGLRRVVVDDRAPRAGTWQRRDGH